VKQAILATVVSVVKMHSDLIAVLLKSEELRVATKVIYTGLNREHSFNRSGSSLEVICSDDPKVKAGDKVPVIVDFEPLFEPSKERKMSLLNLDGGALGEQGIPVRDVPHSAGTNVAFRRKRVPQKHSCSNLL
jgi:hypothetical protein